MLFAVFYIACCGNERRYFLVQIGANDGIIYDPMHSYVQTQGGLGYGCDRTHKLKANV